jgi:hypothetical protein
MKKAYGANNRLRITAAIGLVLLLFLAFPGLVASPGSFAAQENNQPGITPVPNKAKVYPEDNSADDLSFLEFKLNLLKAIAGKDAGFIESIVTPATNFIFGPEPDGPEGLAAMWKLRTDPNSKFWSIMERIVKLGCVGKEQSDGKWYYAPYIYSNFTGDDLSVLVVTGHSVNLRAQANPQGKILEQLDYDIVRIADPMKYQPEAPWIRVIAPSGKTGYVAASYLVSPLGYRAAFKKSEDQWKMMFFVAGD